MASGSDMRQADIAVIGLSGLFAGSANKDAFWDNIIAKKDFVQDAPDSWAKPWYDPNAKSGLGTSRISVRKVGLIGDLAVFDPFELGIAPKALEGDPAHLLGLRLANDALKDAGYDTRPFDRERTGIIVGHGTNPNRGDIAGFQYSLAIDQTLGILSQVLPNLTEDDLEKAREAFQRSILQLETELIPGLVANVISGRIANRLDLMGPNYLVDAACASSIIATDLGMRDLRDGRCDMMLVGGVQASMPAQIYMLFQLLGALSTALIRPFDAAAAGTLLGEGVGFALLKRLPDAVRDDDRIYAVIKGVGVASDGKGFGLLAPRVEGETTAVRRAYEQTGLDPSTIGLVEAHGTGIPLGDRTELQALRAVFGARQGKLPTVAMGSVKSMIGHCIPAAGIASLIKTSLALHHKILPPTICGEVSTEIGIEDTPFYVNTEARPWVHGGDLPRRAGINAFGFGGINTHAILEEYREPMAIPPANIGRWLVRRDVEDPARIDAQPSQPERSWKTWPSELFVFAADSKDEVLARMRAVVAELDVGTDPAELSRRLYLAARGDVRLAVVARDIEDLRQKLALVDKKLPGWERAVMASKKGVYYSQAPRGDGKVAFMFSSEGSQYPGMLKDLCLYFPKVRGWFDFLDQTFPRSPRPSAYVFPPPTCIDDDAKQALRDQLYAGDLATESVSTASQALYELVRDLGIGCDIMVGHSAGEHVALRLSGFCWPSSMERLKTEMRGLNQVYEKLESGTEIPVGVIVSLGGVDYASIHGMLGEFGDAVYLAADNCANQVLLYARNEAAPALLERLKSIGAIFSVLPLDRAYHTPLFGAGGQALRRYYASELMMASMSIPVMSCSTVDVYPQDAASVLDVAAQQWERPVRFREAIERLHADGVRVFVELGPSNSLVAFVDNILKGRDYLAVSGNVQGRPALEQLQHMLAQLYTAKVGMDLRPLWERRGLRANEADAAATKKPSHPVVLRGELPMISLDPAFAATLARKGALVAPNAAVQAPASPSQSSAVPGAAAPRSVHADGAEREAILLRHFELMQEYLRSQTRVTEMLASQVQDDRSR